MRSIWFIRHGESEANAGLPSFDSGSPALTARGHQQSEALATAFNSSPDLIVTSSFLRTQETAAPTILKFPSATIEQWPVEEFTYLSSKNFNHTTVAQRRPASFRYWLDRNPSYVDGPGAESFNQLLARAKSAIFQITKRQETHSLIFSHGWFIRAIFFNFIFDPEAKALYDGHLVNDLRHHHQIGPLLSFIFNKNTILAEKKKMHYFLYFSANFKIPNTCLLKFSIDTNARFSYSGSSNAHVPKQLKGAYFVDR